MADIQIINAYEGNLKNISLTIPRNKFVVFTGVSGSGKSTLLVDVLFQECQRQYLEAMAMQGIHKPGVTRVRGASPAILIPQSGGSKNPRSTVGTVTDVYTDLRMVYEKLGVRLCPYCGAVISAADCKEETEKIGEAFHVYMYCCACGKRMKKLTRTDFSFNTKEGACPDCEGLGRIHSIDKKRVVDETRALEEGAVSYWEQKYGAYMMASFYAALAHLGIALPPGTPVAAYSRLQKDILYYGIEHPSLKEALGDRPLPKTVAAGKFEGVLPVLWRRLGEKNGDTARVGPYFETVDCPDCGGEHLCALSRGVTVEGVRLPMLARHSLKALLAWVTALRETLTKNHKALVDAYLRDMETKLQRLLQVGLGYLSLDRQTFTLSGGEGQRLRLAAILDADLSGVLYMLDEPTIGLHPKDTAGLIAMLQKLRDLDNTVLVIEHDPAVMAAADCIVDIGPGAGRQGGEIVCTGTLDAIKACACSATGHALLHPSVGKNTFRKGEGMIEIKGATKFNLQNVDVQIPLHCITAVTGPSGAGKSTLVFEVLAKSPHVRGLQGKIIEIGQSGITRMKRSNVATYTEVYAHIRKLFAATDAARNAGLTAKHFSFNTPGGRCENCEGMGTVASNMLFFSDIAAICPVCSGNQFQEQVLRVSYRGLSIKAVLKLPVSEAHAFFQGHKAITAVLELLKDVGLGYLELGQSLTTLSGGEGQRLKLARELIGRQSKGNLYLLDEPTMGLHPKDIDHFLLLLENLVEAGNTIIVVEHNCQIIKHSDWVIDLGPGGGEEGGQIVFTGTPKALAQMKNNATGRYL